MKVCVVGAGAIGGYMAVRMAGSGHDVAVIARGPHLAAIRANGMKLIDGDGESVAGNLTCSGDRHHASPKRASRYPAQKRQNDTYHAVLSPGSRSGATAMYHPFMTGCRNPCLTSRSRCPRARSAARIATTPRA